MAVITAAMVGQLRAKTDAPMMECKKALTEADGDLQKAEDLLLRAWGGLWGWIFHGDPGVYTYIAESLARFPDRRQLAELFRTHGFEVQTSALFFCGIVQRITVRKPGTRCHRWG